MMKRAKLLALGILLLAQTAFAQADSTQAPKKDWLRFNGYIKFMQTLTVSPDTSMLVDNLIHNRLNFKAYVGKKSSFKADFRTRIFYGASNQAIPNYGEAVTDYDGVIPLEWVVFDNKSAAMNVIVDRLYYDYSADKYQVRIGRQRINWGINTTWNPNDIFNSYNIYDFDYEEREGSDAVRVKYFPNYNSSFDFAYKFTDKFETDVFAGLYKFNKKNYDYQVLLGKFQEKVAVGVGWAGSIKLIGFKGEATYFQATQPNDQNNLSTSISFDYSWVNGFYFMAAYLYNSTGSHEPYFPTGQTLAIPNAEFLMPTANNVMLNGAKQLSPIMNLNMGLIYGFGANSLTIFPTYTVNLKANLDLDIIGQLFFQELPNQDFSNLGNGIFWRLKGSF
jgi:hypothetical protein